MSDLAYHEPDTLAAALALLHEIDGARCIAGGQTLVAMLNAGLIDAPALIGLGRIAELAGIARAADGRLRIGATATHESIAESPEVRRDCPVLAQAARAIAHPSIRSFGTIGGAVAHGDPAADYPAALVAADAVLEMASASGRRQVAAGAFFRDYLLTALEPGEIVTAILVAAAPAGSRGHYLKFARVDGDYATLSVAGVLATEAGKCRHVAVALGAAGPTPIRDRAGEQGLIGKALTAKAIRDFAAALAEKSDPVDDVRGSSAYRRALIPGLVARAFATLQEAG